MYRLYALDQNMNMVPAIPGFISEEVVDDQQQQCLRDNILAWKVYIKLKQDD